MGLLPRPKPRTSGPGAVLAMLGVRGELPQLEHHTLLFTADWRENFGALREGRVPSPASSYVCRPSATDPSVAPSGHSSPCSATSARRPPSQADSESSRRPSRSKMTAWIKRGTRESNPDLRFWRPPS